MNEMFEKACIYCKYYNHGYCEMHEMLVQPDALCNKYDEESNEREQGN